MSNGFAKTREGVAFKNGKFYSFSSRRIIVIRAWPDPRAWVKTPKRGWRGTKKWADETLVDCFRSADRGVERPLPLNQFILDAKMVSEMIDDGCTPDEIEERRKYLWKNRESAWKDQETCIKPLLEQIPQHIKALIYPLRYRAWHLLCLFARCPESLDLFHANPALAYALSGHWIYRDKKVVNPMRASRVLIKKRQREILDWMGFPGSNSTRRIFQKIDIRNLHPFSLQQMKSSLLDPSRHKILAHLPLITPSILGVLNDDALFRRVSMRYLLNMLEDEAAVADTRWMLRDCIRMDEQLGGGNLPRHFNSFKKLKYCHDELSADVTRLMAGRSLEFPAPPYMGTDDVQPICTLEELIEEGRSMRHCVASRAEMIADGSIFIYRVKSPARATAAIQWKVNRWQLSELRGKSNSNIPVNLRREIKDQLFGGQCLRSGKIATSGERYFVDAVIPEDEVGVAVDKPRQAWAPYDKNGNQLHLSSSESQSLMTNILSVFESRGVAN